MAEKPIRLAKDAEDDLDRIWDYSAAHWGAAQAESYVRGLDRSIQTIASMPEIAREHVEFDPPVRIYPSAEHLIVYLVDVDPITIIRVLASRTNWRFVLGG